MREKNNLTLKYLNKIKNNIISPSKKRLTIITALYLYLINEVEYNTMTIASYYYNLVSIILSSHIAQWDGEQLG